MCQFILVPPQERIEQSACPHLNLNRFRVKLFLNSFLNFLSPLDVTVNFFLDLPVNYDSIKARGNSEHWKRKKKDVSAKRRYTPSGFGDLSRLGRRSFVADYTLHRANRRSSRALWACWYAATSESRSTTATVVRVATNLRPDHHHHVRLTADTPAPIPGQTSHSTLHYSITCPQCCHSDIYHST